MARLAHDARARTGSGRGSKLIARMARKGAFLLGTEAYGHGISTVVGWDYDVWMVDEVTLAARRDIAKDEELTADYALWEEDENYLMPWTCSCGSPLCRGRVTGRDWCLRDLRERHRGHFSPFINDRIARLERSGG
jgi:hypothetical protein